MNKFLTRRIIALLFSTCGAGVLTYIATVKDKEQALVALIAIVSSIIGFYFGTKDS